MPTHFPAHLIEGAFSEKKLSNFEPKMRDVNSVSGEKPHTFEIICPNVAGPSFCPPFPVVHGLHVPITIDKIHLRGLSNSYFS